MRVFLRKIRAMIKTFCLFVNDWHVFVCHSGSLHGCGVDAVEARLTMAYHVIEKGLTMPNRRLDFGHSAILSLIDDIREYSNFKACDRSILEHAIGVVREYCRIHGECRFDKTKDIPFWSAVENFYEKYSSVPCARQIHITREQYLSNIDNLAFFEFAHSRHTCRHFNGLVSDDIIVQAVKLAQTAPSACNRQPVRIHSVSSHDLIKKILSLQNGNRGFADKADMLLVITGDLSTVRWHEERNDVYVNAGIFIMNLCYSLHYYKVAHCILNWSVGIRADRELHRVLGLSMGERVAALIACGGFPDEADIACSPRKSTSAILKIHR